MAAKKSSNRFGGLVIVRTQSAGVHVGKLAEREGDRAVLTDAIRLWRFVPRKMSGRLSSLSECATSGIVRDHSNARTGAKVEAIELAGVIEVIAVSKAVEKDFT